MDFAGKGEVSVFKGFLCLWRGKNSMCLTFFFFFFFFFFFLVSVIWDSFTARQIRQVTLVHWELTKPNSFYFPVRCFTMNHKVFFSMAVDYSEDCFILLYLVARLSLILFSPQRWHIALSKSESLPAQRDGKFTVGLTQILLTIFF